MEAIDETVLTNRYPAYKDSGVDWIGEIPAHWELTRLGTRFSERKQKVSDKDYAPLSVTKQGVVPQLDNAAKTDDGDNRKLVKSGDFVINSRSDRKGSSGISSLDGSVSLINIVLEPKNVEPTYCNYLLKSYNFIEEFYRNGHGIVADLWTTHYSEMKAIMVAIPPLTEQTRIAEFLDHKTAQIDQAIAQKERLIGLLNERRQILIHRAVTRGLNPDAPMKDSGIDWIGEIPAHWVVSKLGNYATVNNGTTPGRDNTKYWHDGTVAWISSGKVNDFTIDQASEFITEKALRECSLKLFPKGTILIGIVGQGKTRGTSALLNIPATINQNLAGVIPNKQLNCNFLHNFFIVSYKEIRNGNGSNQEALNCKLVASIKIVIPSIDEQIEINEFIRGVRDRSEAAVSLEMKALDKLQELKSTLINSAVTGKIKV